MGFFGEVLSTSVLLVRVPQPMFSTRGHLDIKEKSPQTCDLEQRKITQALLDPIVFHQFYNAVVSLVPRLSCDLTPSLRLCTLC